MKIIVKFILTKTLATLELSVAICQVETGSRILVFGIYPCMMQDKDLYRTTAISEISITGTLQGVALPATRQ